MSPPSLMDETLPWEGPGQSLCPLIGLWQRSPGLYSGDQLGISTEGETRTSPPLCMYIQCVEHGKEGIITVGEQCGRSSHTQFTFYTASPNASRDHSSEN